MTHVRDPYWMERDQPEIHGQGTVSTCGMSYDDMKACVKREKKPWPFGFQAPTAAAKKKRK